MRVVFHHNELPVDVLKYRSTHETIKENFSVSDMDKQYLSELAKSIQEKAITKEAEGDILRHLAFTLELASVTEHISENVYDHVCATYQALAKFLIMGNTNAFCLWLLDSTSQEEPPRGIWAPLFFVSSTDSPLHIYHHHCVFTLDQLPISIHQKEIIRTDISTHSIQQKIFNKI